MNTEYSFSFPNTVHLLVNVLPHKYSEEKVGDVRMSNLKFEPPPYNFLDSLYGSAELWKKCDFKALNFGTHATYRYKKILSYGATDKNQHFQNGRKKNLTLDKKIFCIKPHC